MWLEIHGTRICTSTPRRGGGDEGPEQGAVGDEVGIGNMDVVLRSVDGGDVHVADRENESADVVGAQAKGGLEASREAQAEAPAARLMAVPEVHEGLGGVGGVGTDDAQVGIAPFGGVELADVVAADEGHAGRPPRAVCDGPGRNGAGPARARAG